MRKWGGTADDYLPIHQWFDESKAHHGDFRHRALRHHAEGIFLMETIFGGTIELSTCKRCGKPRHEGTHDVAIRGMENVFMDAGGRGVELAEAIDEARANECSFEQKKIPTRWVGEQHVIEDMGRIPAATEWLSEIQAKPWMNRSRRLSRELEEMDGSRDI